MRLLSASMLLLALTGFACGARDSAPTATPAAPTAAASATPQPSPTPETVVTGPHTLEDAFAEDVLIAGASWEIDVATGDVYVVTGPRRIVQNGRTRDTTRSADRRWEARARGPDVDLLDDGRPAFLIRSALFQGWSGEAALLYLRRNETCARSDLYVFDPVTGVLRDLTGGGAQPLEQAWSPDGTLLALHFVGRGREREIVLIDTATAEMRTLLPGPARGGEYIPIGWSDDGARLGVYYNPGRDFCDLADPPTPLPATTVERLN
jgi:hypothetical protein